MPGGRYDSSLTRVRPFFSSVISKSPGGHPWLAKLLAATPNGGSVLRDLVDHPGPLDQTLTTVQQSGLLGAFEYPVAAQRQLLSWYVEHPEVLVWPPGASFSAETTRMRRALLEDTEPGRAEAQAQARHLVETRAPASRGWWRFEGVSMIDCMLMTDKPVITIEGKRTESLSSATDWYPKRSQLVRNLEAANQVAHGRAWASLVISERPITEASEEALWESLPMSAPHLEAGKREELYAHYLGNMTWEQTCAAVDLPFDTLPDATADH